MSLTEQLKTKTCSKKKPTQFILFACAKSSYQSLQQLHPFLIHGAFGLELYFCAALLYSCHNSSCLPISDIHQHEELAEWPFIVHISEKHKKT